MPLIWARGNSWRSPFALEENGWTIKDLVICNQVGIMDVWKLEEGVCTGMDEHGRSCGSSRFSS